MYAIDKAGNGIVPFVGYDDGVFSKPDIIDATARALGEAALPAANLNTALTALTATQKGAFAADGTFTIPGRANTVTRSPAERIKDDAICLFDYLNVLQIADVTSRAALNDLKTEIDNAIADAKAEHKALYCPAGSYRTTGTHYLARATAPNFDGFAGLIGDGGLGPAQSGTGGYVAQTLFLADQVERPVFAIENARGVLIEGIGFGIHPNRGWSLYQGEPVDTEATYIPAGARTDRYSPFCAVAIDPTNGPVPTGGGYTAVSSPLTYQGRTGGVGGSAHITFRDCAFEGFTVGVVMQPDSVTLQGDRVNFDNCRWQGCSVAIGIGNTQTRGVCINGGAMEYCRTGVDGLTYGAQTGCPPHEWSGTQFILTFRLFKLHNGYGHLTLTSLYCETTKYIGTWGLGASGVKCPLTMIGCEFHIGYSGWSRVPFVLESHGPVEARGTSIEYGYDIPEAVNLVGSSTIDFNGGKFAGLNTGYAPVIGSALDLGGALITLRRMSTSESTSLSLDDEPPRTFSLPSRIRASHRMTQVESSTGRWLYQPGGVNSYVANAATSVAIDGTTGVLSFTPGDATLYVQGDILFWQMLAMDTSIKYKVPAFKVTSATGASTVTATPLWHKSYYDSVANNGSTMYIYQQEWAPGTPLTADLNSTMTISNVSPTTILQVGDWLGRCSGLLPVNCRVTAIAGSTVTVNKTAASTRSGVRLAFGRLYPQHRYTGANLYSNAGIAAGATATATVIVPGASVGDFAEATYSVGLSGIVILSCEITGVEVATVTFSNPTGGSLAVASGVVTVIARPHAI